MAIDKVKKVRGSTSRINSPKLTKAHVYEKCDIQLTYENKRPLTCIITNEGKIDLRKDGGYFKQRLSGTHTNEDTKKKRKFKRGKRHRKIIAERLKSLNWEARARCDVKLMWQITIGEGQDIYQDQEDYLYKNDWTPTEDDRKLFDQQKDEYKQEFPSLTSPRPFRQTCGKESCFFEHGSLLYL